MGFGGGQSPPPLPHHLPSIGRLSLPHNQQVSLLLASLVRDCCASAVASLPSSASPPARRLRLLALRPPSASCASAVASLRPGGVTTTSVRRPADVGRDRRPTSGVTVRPGLTGHPPAPLGGGCSVPQRPTVRQTYGLRPAASCHFGRRVSTRFGAESAPSRGWRGLGPMPAA